MANVYFEGMGWRNLINDHKEIIWFWSLRCKQKIRTLGGTTALLHEMEYWRAIKKAFAKVLVVHEAYELIAFLKAKERACLAREAVFLIQGDNDILCKVNSDLRAKLYRRFSNPN